MQAGPGRFGNFGIRRPGARGEVAKNHKNFLFYKELWELGFVGPEPGSFVEKAGSIVRISGSIVDSAGSFAVACCRIRDISGRMSRRMRHHESLCRGIRDIPAGLVAENATTRARMSRRMHQPERFGAPDDRPGRPPGQSHKHS